jgi:hypothetical protein
MKDIIYAVVGLGLLYETNGLQIHLFLSGFEELIEKSSEYKAIEIVMDGRRRHGV